MHSLHSALERRIVVGQGSLNVPSTCVHRHSAAGAGERELGRGCESRPPEEKFVDVDAVPLVRVPEDDGREATAPLVHGQ